MGYKKARPEDADSVIPEDAGGMWFLKDELDTDYLGFTVLELEPGESGKEHDHDEQEEIYYVEQGSVDIEVEEESVPLEEGEAIRIDPGTTRQIVNRDQRSRLVLVGGPR